MLYKVLTASRVERNPLESVTDADFKRLLRCIHPQNDDNQIRFTFHSPYAPDTATASYG